MLHISKITNLSLFLGYGLLAGGFYVALGKTPTMGWANYTLSCGTVALVTFIVRFRNTTRHLGHPSVYIRAGTFALTQLLLLYSQETLGTSLALVASLIGATIAPALGALLLKEFPTRKMTISLTLATLSGGLIANAPPSLLLAFFAGALQGSNAVLNRYLGMRKTALSSVIFVSFLFAHLSGYAYCTLSEIDVTVNSNVPFVIALSGAFLLLQGAQLAIAARTSVTHAYLIGMSRIPGAILVTWLITGSMPTTRTLTAATMICFAAAIGASSIKISSKAAPGVSSN